MAAFDEVPDPRRPQSRRYPLRAMLSLLALGLLMGAKNVKDIWQSVAALSQKQRRALGLRARHPDKGLHVALPGYDALNDLLGAVDPAAFARALNAWMQAADGTLPRAGSRASPSFLKRRRRARPPRNLRPAHPSRRRPEPRPAPRPQRAERDAHPGAQKPRPRRQSRAGARNAPFCQQP